MNLKIGGFWNSKKKKNSNPPTRVVALKKIKKFKNQNSLNSSMAH